jgi:hypothetical protein
MAQSTTASKRCCEQRYCQLAAMNIGGLPVIAVRIQSVIGWGDLTTRQTSE